MSTPKERDRVERLAEELADFDPPVEDGEERCLLCGVDLEEGDMELCFDCDERERVKLEMRSDR